MWIEYFIKAFTEEFPIFMSLITISGLAVIINIILHAKKSEGDGNPDTILIAGLIALIISLLIYPIDIIFLFNALSDAENFSVAIVGGGYYVGFVPLIYGFSWFLISFFGWRKYKKGSLVHT